MLTVITQDQTAQYEIEYFYLKHDEEYNVYKMIGRARFNLTDTDLVLLGIYNFYRQAIEVFATMDYNANDLMYYRTQKKIYQMPPNITDERELNILYPISPF